LITLSFPSSPNETTEIQVYDLFGSLVDETNVTPIGQITSTTIDVSTYASGVYVIQINNHSAQTAKFIKP